MRLAIIADIHSNLPALQAVLADIDQFGVDEIIVAGDAINGGPFPGEVLELIQERQLSVVKGNHENYILECANAATKNRYQGLNWGSVRWTLSQLSSPQLRTIQEWPISLERPNMLIVHGSPEHLSGGIQPDVSDDVIAERFGKIQHPLIITAHTHIPFVRQWQHLTLINPGSVGMPLDYNAAASYVLLENRGESFLIRHRRVAYDTSGVEKATRERGLLEAGGPVTYLMMQETLTGRPYLVAYLVKVQEAMAEGLSQAEAFQHIPLPI